MPVRVGRWFARPVRAAGTAAAIAALVGTDNWGAGRHEPVQVRMAANNEYMQGHANVLGQEPLRTA